jgi:DNA-directed RNA polymerase subunit RPC12/RpoP
MNWLQRLVLSVVPRSWGEAIEAESRSWMLRCTQCGRERSLWEWGGMRWKSTKPTQHYRVRCPQCGGRRWHTLSRPSPHQQGE